MKYPLVGEYLRWVHWSNSKHGVAGCLNKYEMIKTNDYSRQMISLARVAFCHTNDYSRLVKRRNLQVTNFDWVPNQVPGSRRETD